MTILEVDPGTLLFGLRLSVSRKWAGIFIGKYGLVLWGAGDDKKPEEINACPDCGWYPGERTIFYALQVTEPQKGEPEED